mmetsp:Transcript_34743/g.76050  ORF Transcript_34743/g.76050 Transcript_34743/m.76050 type:complete len:206 (-) Transcript_34743:506-1123(-)
MSNPISSPLSARLRNARANCIRTFSICPIRPDCRSPFSRAVYDTTDGTLGTSTSSIFSNRVQDCCSNPATAVAFITRSCTATEAFSAKSSDSIIFPACDTSLGVFAQHSFQRASTSCTSLSSQSDVPDLVASLLSLLVPISSPCPLLYPFSSIRHFSTLSTTHFRPIRLFGAGRRLLLPLLLLLMPPTFDLLLTPSSPVTEEPSR